MLTDYILHLASQHHASDYNRSKFGAHGSPIHYLPLSLHLPDQFTQLRSKQFQLAERQPWWPAAHQQLSLQDEIIAAMSTSLVQSQPSHLPSVKTSLTHPINISFMIPPELIALISSHALLVSTLHSPTLLEIPPNFTLGRLSVLRDARLQQRPPPIQPRAFSIPPGGQTNHFRTRSHITNALQAAISTGMDSVVHTPSDGRIESKQSFLTGFAAETSVSLSLSLKTIPPSMTNSLHPLPDTPASDLPTWPTDHNVLLSTQAPRFPSTFTIGNLYLSSCPGKKVRLDGPVKGRSGVCRDLETDLTRMKQMGVSCIVCCLDDDELEYLGAPWLEYERCAKKIGIDVLRLPTPEGLPPISASHLDGYLVDLINRYTLRGIPVLVHCRGGVGRAGVVACCWMIRLGLCGWISEDVQSSETMFKHHTDTLSFVQSVIALVRRRRSMKAVETYEQVKFLVDYVDYLRLNLEPVEPSL